MKVEHADAVTGWCEQQKNLVNKTLLKNLHGK